MEGDYNIVQYNTEIFNKRKLKPMSSLLHIIGFLSKDYTSLLAAKYQENSQDKQNTIITHKTQQTS